MVELDGMAEAASQLRGGIAEADAALQDAGAVYYKKLGELQELRRTQSAMAATRHVRTLRNPYVIVEAGAALQVAGAVYLEKLGEL